MVVCGSYITMETEALSCREDTDAPVSAELAAERSNMTTTKSTGPLGRCLALYEIRHFKKMSFAANFTVLTVYKGSDPDALNHKIRVHTQIISDVLRVALL